jgi:hypothetical protein
MKKDIPKNEVSDIVIALVKEPNGVLDFIWAVHILNLKDEPVSNVLISASGEGKDGLKTATTRYFLEALPARTSRQLEVILPETMTLNHRYWVSFQENGNMLDKRFMLEHQRFEDELLDFIPVLNTLGLLVE